MRRFLAVSLMVALGPACSGSAHVRAPETTEQQAPASPPPIAAETGWQDATLSPRTPSDDDTVGDASLGDLCGKRDHALEQVADWLAGRERPTSSAPDVAEISYAIRRSGAPYVWPRAWIIEGATARENAPNKMQAWLSSAASQGERRCGVAVRPTAHGGQLVVAVTSEALADLEPLPTVVSSGAWLDVRVRLLVPAGVVKIVVLGPRGRPFPVASSREGDLVRARFRADRPGVWLVQALATVAGGPRPVAEALVHADVAPVREFTGSPAPGEDQGTAEGGASALFAMVNAARRSERLPALERDPRLDQLALEHASAMKIAQRVAHDVGGGDPATRVQAAGVDVQAAGENVVHAVDEAHAHRSLWASPSHRENLLLDRFDVGGVGVARDEDGTVWVCEIFADRP